MGQSDIPAGALLMLSEGEYSDYHHAGHFVALEIITRARMAEIAEAVKKAHSASEDANVWTGDVREMFIAAMIREGLLLALTVTEIHIGSYGELEL